MKSLLFAATVSLLLVTSGCSVLTGSQVKEVNNFAMAAKDYADMPGTVIAEHARIRKVRLVLGAAMDRNGDTALQAIKVALNQQKNLEERGQQADAALKVLKDYAELLVNLTSDQFTTNLQASSESLGQSIDKWINHYNKVSGSDFRVFGSDVAAIVRGIGGIRIRNLQEKALRSAVTSADPVVRSMTWTVEETMALYLDKEQFDRITDLAQEKSRLQPGGFLSMEKDAVMDKYRTSVDRFEGRQPPSLPLTVADEMRDADNAAALAAKTLTAARDFRVAHEKLSGMIREKRDLPEMIAEVQALVEEVKAARDLKKQLEKQ